MGKMKRSFLMGLLSVSIIILIGLNEEVQSQGIYPTKPIEIIVTFGPGGGIDLNTRITAAYLNKKWGVPVSVVNKPGGKTISGQLELYNAAPDGYTVLGDNTLNSSLLGATIKNLPFEIMNRTFIAMVSIAPFCIIVPSTSPFKTLEDFITEAKKNPGNISWTGGDLGIEFVLRRFFSEIGVDISKMKLVMITGGAQGVALVAGGHVTVGASRVSSSLPAIKGGSVRPLLITYKDRYPELPDIPTSVELGYPKLIVMTWVGISGPPKLPSYIVEIWDKALQEMTKDPRIISQLKNIGDFPFYYDAQATREYVKREVEEAQKLLAK